MAHNRSFFLQALDRTETRTDGGFKHSWGCSLPADRQKEKSNEERELSEEDVQQQPPTSPEDKSCSFRNLCSSDSSRTHENRSNSLVRPGNKLGPKRLEDVPLSTPMSSPVSTRTNYMIFRPTLPQGIVIQGRHFQHAQLPLAIRKPLQRNELSSSEQVVEVDSIVLTCPEVPAEDTLNIKRRVQQKRKPFEDVCVSSQLKVTEQLVQPIVYHAVCRRCNKPSRDSTKCLNCGTGTFLLPRRLPTSSSPTPRAPIRPQPSPGPNSLQQNIYKLSAAMREPLPVRILNSRGTLSLLDNGPGTRTPLLAGTSSYCETGTPTKGRRPAAQKHELNDPIILSSDEDDEANNANTASVNRLDSVSPRPADSAHSSPAPSGGKVETAVRSVDEQEELNAEFFKNVDMKITIPRRARMKDQFGNEPPESSVPRTKRPRVMSSGCDSIILECRSIRIGTLRRIVKKPVVFSVDHIQLETEGLESGSIEKICLQTSELISCEWCSVRKLPVLFFQTTVAECVRLRSQLSMSREEGGQWYDCTESQMDEKYIVLILENGLVMKEQVILEDILHAIGRTNNLSTFPTKLTFDEANIRLVNYNKASSQKWEKAKPAQSPPKVSPACVPTRTRMATRQQTSTFFDEEDEDMTDLQPTFSGPVVKLMMYPPPPAKGGISVTNEDLHCLNDGEFLNDVIIDFYLKYLVLEKLKKEDAQRIHVFSSFFYKRLNQRERRSGPDTTSLPIQKRKHNRVKTWTRHVDLFQKDFIFVPINESAHWYLAVICFPGLEGPVYEKNPLYLDPTLASVSAAEPQSEENIPDHCRPLSPDLDGLSDQAEESAEVDCDPHSENSEEAQEPPGTNWAEPEQQYPSELHRISVCYGSGRDDDTYTFSDEQSSCQDECSEDGALAEDAADGSSLASKATICKQPCILIMDSLRGPTRSNVVKTLREYLEVEWEVRKGFPRSFGKEVMRGSSPRVPQQDNFSDCGVYVLQYVESCFENPIPSFELPVNLSEWFPQLRMKTKREEIKELILKIQAQQDQGEAPPTSLEAPEIEETSGSNVQLPNSPISP
ncbi:sentrin-specific protease 6 [Nematolebias whitei]|uniref:sentrin-specific protease 6 n=1 Tax=Nematolebias whitei TaxID=451745 RepID=UPI001897028D|nr:sentrin-specific protease 6 [Nematolebias whitei]